MHKIAIMSALLLAGCTQAEPAPEPSPSTGASVTRGDPGDQPGLQTISYDQLSSMIEPGLGCSFATEDDRLLFVATATMEPAEIAQGVIMAKDAPEVVTAQEEGGYEALVDGATFTATDGASVTITRTSEEGTPGEIETTSWPAELDYESGQGVKRRYIGSYSCGA